MFARSVYIAFLAIAIHNVSGCSQQPAAPDETAEAATPKAAMKPPTCESASDIVLRGELHGAISGALVGRIANTECRGMPRPKERGLRLHFRTTGTATGAPFVAILGIDGLGRGDTGASLRTTVTLIDEDAERFFSTGEQPSCFTDIKEHRYTKADARSDIAGVLWCTAAVPQINGQLSVRINELFFQGNVQWPKAPK